MPAENAILRVSVVFALPERAWIAELDVPEGTTVADAFVRSGLPRQVPALNTATITFAIFGKPVTPATLLRDGDRLELLRDLLADPKMARRRRARHSG